MFALIMWLKSNGLTHVMGVSLLSLLWKALHSVMLLSYKKGWDRLGLYSQERGRLKSDMKGVYKIMKGLDRVMNHCLSPRLKVEGMMWEEKDSKGTWGETFNMEAGRIWKQISRGSSRVRYNSI